jgi:2-iminobutanoate/2-iminopropanoate deaminase
VAIEFVTADEAPKPMGPYSVGVRVGGVFLTAGQLPIDPATGSVVAGGIREQTRRCILNLEAVLRVANVNLRSVAKLTVFLTDINDLAAVAEVRREFWDDPHPVSTTVETSRLAHPDALIEIDVLALDE